MNISLFFLFIITLQTSICKQSISDNFKYMVNYILVNDIMSLGGRPFHPFVPSFIHSSSSFERRRWWNGRKTMIHGDGSSLSTCSCDLVSTVCFSTVKLFLCDLQEFSRASDGGSTTIETKWRHGEERY